MRLFCFLSPSQDISKSVTKRCYCMTHILLHLCLVFENETISIDILQLVIGHILKKNNPIMRFLSYYLTANLFHHPLACFAVLDMYSSRFRSYFTNQGKRKDQTSMKSLFLSQNNNINIKEIFYSALVSLQSYY